MEQNNKQRKPLDYNNGKIYKIVNDTNDKIYIGSSTTTLPKRLANHKKRNPKDMHKPFYQDLFDNIGKDHFQIILIEKYSCNSKLELERREYEIIQQHVNELGRDKIYNLRCSHTDYSEECRKKLSEANKKENKTPMTEEQKKAISQRTIGENNPMYNKRGDLAPSFKRGSIRYDNIKSRWCFEWTTYDENGIKKRNTKSFSIGVWGEDGAKEQCVKLQNEIYPL